MHKLTAFFSTLGETIRTAENTIQPDTPPKEGNHRDKGSSFVEAFQFGSKENSPMDSQSSLGRASLTLPEPGRSLHISSEETASPPVMEMAAIETVIMNNNHDSHATWLPKEQAGPNLLGARETQNSNAFMPRSETMPSLPSDGKASTGPDLLHTQARNNETLLSAVPPSDGVNPIVSTIEPRDNDLRLVFTETHMSETSTMPLAPKNVKTSTGPDLLHARSGEANNLLMADTSYPLAGAPLTTLEPTDSDLPPPLTETDIIERSIVPRPHNFDEPALDPRMSSSHPSTFIAGPMDAQTPLSITDIGPIVESPKTLIKGASIEEFSIPQSTLKPNNIEQSEQTITQPNAFQAKTLDDWTAPPTVPLPQTGLADTTPAPATVFNTGTPVGAEVALTAPLPAQPVGPTSLPNGQTLLPQPVHAQQVGQAIIEAIETGDKLTLRLNPPEMGRVYIDFSFDSAKAVSVIVRPEIADMSAFLRDRIETLNATLEEHGFKDVSVHIEQNDTSDQNQDEKHKAFYLTRETDMAGLDPVEMDILSLNSRSMALRNGNAPIDIRL